MTPRAWALAALGVVVLVAGLAAWALGVSAARAVATAVDEPAPTAPSASPAGSTGPGVDPSRVRCTIRGPLPDPACTPGASDPAVTQSNIGTTICVSGYTRTVRPPAAYTDQLKREQLVAYGLAGGTADYEEDHLIPLELGGHPRDPRNLWPEPRAGSPGAGDKDRYENWLHARVCAGSLGLEEAQRRIATDWVRYWLEAGRP